jgi:hypothetical protein
LTTKNDRIIEILSKESELKGLLKGKDETIDSLNKNA